MQTGLTHTSTLKVAERHLAMNVGSGDLPVLATPVMMMLMENAAMLAVAPELSDDESTVGGQIASSHLHPTPLNSDIRATATLTAVEGRKLTFKVEAYDSAGLIGEGTHLRFIINKEKFMSKLQQP